MTHNGNADTGANGRRREMDQETAAFESCPAACRPSGIVRQFAKPTGWIGWCVGRLMAVKNRKRGEWVISLMQVQSADRVLEVGFGPGVDVGRVSAIAVRGFVAGIDHSAVMVEQARRRNAAAVRAKRVELRHASASRIPYGDIAFDKAFSINAAQFWEEPRGVLEELRRVLRPGGLVALAVQPRIPNATEATAHETGGFLAGLLTTTGFESVRVETKQMQPAPVVCALGTKRSSNG